MTDQNNRNTAIEALRFIVMLQICLWHYHDGIGTMQAGFIGVEFFFILSGIFLYRTATRSQSPGILEFTLRKAGKFYIDYLMAIIAAYIVFMPNLIEAFRYDTLHTLLQPIGQLLMIQNIGPFYGGINTPLWFFSVLIYGGAIVYALTKYHTRMSIRLIFPLTTLLFFSYAFNYGHGDGLEQWRAVGAFPMPMVRGIADIALGVMPGYIIFNYMPVIQRHTRTLDVATLLATAGYIAIVARSRADTSYAIIFIAIILTAALNGQSAIHRLFKSRKWLIMGGVTFDLFLIHYPLIAAVSGTAKLLHLPAVYSHAAYIIILIPAAFIFKAIADRLRKTLASRHNPTQNP